MKEGGVGVGGFAHRDWDDLTGHRHRLWFSVSFSYVR
jgi:hypothetical protein